MAHWNDLGFLTEAAKKRNAHLFQDKPEKPKKQKYNSRVTVYDGVKYHSALEAKRAAQLDLLVKAGEVLYWCRQPQFVLGNGVTYKADFIVWYADGEGIGEVEDIKGMSQSEFIRTEKMLKKRFPDLELVVLGQEDI